MSRERGATSLPGEPETFVQQPRSSGNSICAGSTGSQLDGKRDAVHFVAYPGNYRSVGVRQLRAIPASRGTLHEQLRSRIAQCFRSRQASFLRRSLERAKDVDMLAFDPQCLATGCQDMGSWRLVNDSLGQLCCCSQHRLAVIEHEKKPLIPEMSEKSGNWIVRMSRASQR